MRYKLLAYDNAKLIEEYYLGRIWVPLNYCAIRFDVDGDNYDSAEPNLESAFDMLKNPQLISSKDVGNFGSLLRFIENPDTASLNMVYSRFQRFKDEKLSFSRLYWRIWTSIAEASYWKDKKETWHVNGIASNKAPIELSSALSYSTVLADASFIKPFFISTSMLDQMAGLDLLQYFYFLLCDTFHAETHFGVNTCWPDLESVQLVFPTSGPRLRTLCTAMYIRSSELYVILHYLARITNQLLQLIEEIGRSVFTFLNRPEGDTTFLGHSHISLSLPIFRCAKTTLFLWPITLHELPYEPRKLPIYKLKWLGIIHYSMLSLSANGVLTEFKVPTALQLL